MSTATKLAIAAAVIGGGYYVLEYRPAQKRKRRKKKDLGGRNPASVHCMEQGGKVDLRTGADGGQYGVCVFPDGREVEEWAYFRGEAQPEVPLPEPPGPGERYPLRPPPNPGVLLEANTQDEVADLIPKLLGVPTAVYMPFSDGSVDQKLRPLLLEYVEAYPEVQFVLSDLGQMVGTKSNVVALDVGVDLGADVNTGGLSLLLADGPKTAEQQLAENQEPATPRWPASNYDTLDMENVTGEIHYALEQLLERIEGVPKLVGFETMPANYVVVADQQSRQKAKDLIDAWEGRAAVVAEVDALSPIYQVVVDAMRELAKANSPIVFAVANRAFMESVDTSGTPPGAWGRVIAAVPSKGDIKFDKNWAAGTSPDQVVADLAGATESTIAKLGVAEANPNGRVSIFGI